MGEVDRFRIYNWTFCCPVLGSRHCTVLANTWPCPTNWHRYSQLFLKWSMLTVQRWREGSTLTEYALPPPFSILVCLIYGKGPRPTQVVFNINRSKVRGLWCILAAEVTHKEKNRSLPPLSVVNFQSINQLELSLLQELLPADLAECWDSNQNPPNLFDSRWWINQREWAGRATRMGRPSFSQGKLFSTSKGIVSRSVLFLNQPGPLLYRGKYFPRMCPHSRIYKWVWNITCKLNMKYFSIRY